MPSAPCRVPESSCPSRSFSSLPSPCSAAQPPDFDVLIAGGRVVDGTGTPWFRGDVGLKGDRIAAIGDLTGRTAARRIDAAGMVVAPGFIDMLGQSEMNLLVDSRAASKVLMGVTTEVTGEGTSIAPVNDTMIRLQRREPGSTSASPRTSRTLAEYFTRLETRNRPAINLGTFVGAGGIRTTCSARSTSRRVPPTSTR